ncbi:MAG: hypothetical protein L6Q59_15360 [Ignavibacteriaceae bacterium]|nr:hypothetical protein [Ignavibacteriaceae bacterium]
MDRVSGISQAEERGEAEVMNLKDNVNLFAGIQLFVEKLHNLRVSGAGGSFYLSELAGFILLMSGSGDRELIQANFEEFRSDFLQLLEKYCAEGRPPSETEKVLAAAEMLSGQTGYESAEVNISRIRKELKYLNSVLSGSETRQREYAGRLYFPLIEISSGEFRSGYLDKVEITLTPGKSEHKFRILSRYDRSDEILPIQIKTSFLTALSLLKLNKGEKERGYFNVFVSFTGDLGEYSGDSLGAILTLSFMLELYNFYYRQKTWKPGDLIALTGAVDETGNLIPTGENNISVKAETVFYSGIKYFIVPEQDAGAAGIKIKELQKQYPDRKPVIVPVSNITEVFNRRNLIEIEKKPVAKRIAEFSARHLASLIFASLLVVLGVLYYHANFDDNPFSIRTSGKYLFVENKAGTVLWSKEVYDIDQSFWMENRLNQTAQVIDADNDGKNEVLIARLKSDDSAGVHAEMGIGLFDKFGKPIWQYSFNDTVYSFREGYMQSVYVSYIMDILKNEGRKTAYVMNVNVASYASALIAIDLITGQKIAGTLWSPGHFLGGKIITETDVAHKIFVVAANNDLERITTFLLNKDIPDGQLVSSGNYELRGVKFFVPDLYMSFGLNDFDRIVNHRYPIVFPPTYRTKDYNYAFSTSIRRNKIHTLFNLWIDIRNGEVFLYPGDEFRVLRDSLVAAGKLNPPYTDTKEYIEAYRESIQYYTEGRWISFQEYHRLRKEGKLKVNK